MIRFEEWADGLLQTGAQLNVTWVDTCVPQLGHRQCFVFSDIFLYYYMHFLFMSKSISKWLPSRLFLQSFVCSHPRQLWPQRGDVWRRYRAIGGDMFSINSGTTRWTRTSKARINLHGEPTTNRLRARRSALGARRSVSLMFRPPWRICLLIIKGSVLYVC